MRKRCVGFSIAPRQRYIHGSNIAQKQSAASTSPHTYIVDESRRTERESYPTERQSQEVARAAEQNTHQIG